MKRVGEHRKLLGVDKTATLKDLKTIYRNTMKDAHPDKFVNDEEAKLEAEEKSKREREEMNRIFEVFQGQSESMQDVILDMVESKIEATVQVPAFINEIKKHRKSGEIKLFQGKTKSKFKEAMQENGLI